MHTYLIDILDTDDDVESYPYIMYNRETRTSHITFTMTEDFDFPAYIQQLMDEYKVGIDQIRLRVIKRS